MDFEPRDNYCFLTNKEKQHIEDLRLEKEEYQRLKNENSRLKKPTINIGTYPPEIADMILEQLQSLRGNKNLFTTARVERIRRKGRGSRKEHGNQSYIPLEHATGIAIYIDMDVKTWRDRVEEKSSK